jgi:hypothetical protein
MKTLLLSILLLASTLFANVGKVVALKGDATVTRGGQNLPVNLGLILQEKDQIKTSKNARLQLQFTDKTVISLGKESVFDVEEYFFDEKQPTKTKASFKMAKGIFKSITGKIGKINPSKFTLKTKTASIGIRGTIFFGTIAPDKPDNIACTQGEIVVQTDQGIVTVPAGQFTTVQAGQAPTPPKALPEAEVNNLEQDSGASENEAESGENEQAVQQEKDNTPAPALGTPADDGTPPAPDNTPNTGGLVDDAKNTVDTAQDVADTTAATELTNPIDTIVMHLPLTTHLSLSVENNEIFDDPYNNPFSYITNDSITAEFGAGTLMSVSNPVNLSQDINFKWGFWSSDTTEQTSTFIAEKAWVLGQNAVNDLSELTSANDAMYVGSIMGSIMGSASDEAFINPLTSSIMLNFDFGANSVSVEANYGSQLFNITGNFSSSGAIYTIQDTADSANTLKGSFYDSMNTTAGIFNVDGYQGVYNATKDPGEQIPVP